MEQYNRLLKKFILNNINYPNLVEDLQILVSPNETIFQRFVQDFDVFFHKLLKISTSTTNIEARNAVHDIHETIKQVVSKNPTIRNQKWWNEMSSTYLTPGFQDAVISQIREDDPTWIKSWSLMVNLMVKNSQLKGCSVNALLKIVEVAFRLSKTKPILADQAFICWIELIEIISSNNNSAQINKIGGLFVKPLATNVPPKTYALKLKAWDTLIDKIAIPYDDHVVDIVVSFLKTAFNQNNNCLAHHMPNECLALIEKLLNAKTIDKYSIQLISTLSQCAHFEVDPVHFSSLFVQIISYCLTLKGEKFINHLKELLRQTIVSSKSLKKFPNFTIITKIGFMMDSKNFLETMNDFKIRNELLMPFMNLVIENKDIHTTNSRNKEIILGTWQILFSVFITHLSINEITEDEKDMLLSLIVFPLLLNSWSSAISKPWIGFCETLKKKEMFTEQGENLINYMMDCLKQSEITTLVVLEILKIISNLETTLWDNFVPLLELVCEKMPKDFNQIMSVIHLTELAIGVDPKSTHTLLNLKLTSAANNFDQLQQHKIKTSLLKLRKKFLSSVGSNSELKFNTSPDAKQNGSFSMKSNFLYRMARAEEKKKDSISSISNLFNTKEKSEETKTEKENFDDVENQKKEENQEKDISITNKLLDVNDKPVDYVEKENLPKSPLLVKSNQIHIVRNDKSKSPKISGLNKSRKSPEKKVIGTPKRTTPSKCTYFDNDNASDYVVVVPKQTTTVLTEHQKEVMSKRRADIPALYQDLTQDTQSISFIEDTKSNDKKNVDVDTEIPSHNFVTPDRTEFLKPNKACSAKKLDFGDQFATRPSTRNFSKNKEEEKMDVELEEKIFNKRKSDPGNRAVSNILLKKPNGETDPVPKKRGRKKKELLEDDKKGMPLKKINVDTDTSESDCTDSGNLSVINVLQIKTKCETDPVPQKRGRKKKELEDDKKGMPVKKINVDTDTSESDCTDSGNLSVPNVLQIKTNSETDFITKKRGRKRKDTLEDYKKGSVEIFTSLESVCTQGNLSVASVIPETPNCETDPVAKKRGRKTKESLGAKEGTPINKINTETNETSVESICTPSNVSVGPITQKCETDPVAKKRGRKTKESLGAKEGTPFNKINTDTTETSVKFIGTPSNLSVGSITPKCETDPVAKKRGRKISESLGAKEGTPVNKINKETTHTSVESISTPGNLSVISVLPITPKCETDPVKKTGRKIKESGDNREATPVNTEIIEETQTTKEVQKSPKCDEVNIKTPECDIEIAKKLVVKTTKSDELEQETPKCHESVSETSVEKLCEKCNESVVSKTSEVKLCKKCEESFTKETTPEFKDIFESSIIKTHQIESSKINDSDLISFTPLKVGIASKQYFNKNIKESPNVSISKIKSETEESRKNQVEDKMEVEDVEKITNQSIVHTPKSVELVLKDTPKFDELFVNETTKPNDNTLITEDSEITTQEGINADKTQNNNPNDSSSKTEESLQNQVEDDQMEVEFVNKTPHKRKRSDLESPVSENKKPKLEIESTPLSTLKRTHRQKQRKRILQSNSKCTINFTPNNLEQWLYKLNKDVVKKDLIEEPKESETEIRNVNFETPKENQNLAVEETPIEVDENIKTPVKCEEPDKTLAYSRGVSLLSSFVENDEVTKLHLASTREIPKIPPSPSNVLSSPVTSRAGRIMLLTKENALLTPTKRRNIIPQKFGENWPKGPTEEWIAHNPDHEKTPVRSSLKVANQAKDVKTSEETQPKRVSFLDPPVTLGLIFNNDNTGALHLNDTPQDTLKRVWANENTNKIVEVEENVVIVSDEETGCKTDEYDLKSLPNLRDCDKPVTHVLLEMDNYSILENEFMKLGVKKVNEMLFFTKKTVEQLTIKSPKQQTLYLAVKAFLEKEEKIKNQSHKEVEEKTTTEIKGKKSEDESNKHVEETNQPKLINIASYQGVITPQQLLQLAENNKSFLESLHDLMTTEFLSKVVLSKIAK